MDPITIFDDEFIKLSFSWALCLKQILYLSIFLFLVFVIAQFSKEKTRTEEFKDKMIDTLGSVIKSQSSSVYRDIEIYQHNRALENAQQANDLTEEQDDQSEQRRQERIKKINSALSARGENSKTKTCSSCGGIYGTKSTCQYCGQP